jgi:hypothetical protein
MSPGGDPVVVALDHAIENFEMLSGIGQQFRICGVIRALNRNDHRADLRMFFSQECYELFLRLRRSSLGVNKLH